MNAQSTPISGDGSINNLDQVPVVTYEAVSKSFRTESLTKYTLTTTNTR